MSKPSDSNRGPRTIATNRKARHEFFIEETYEAGIVLTGTEIKSARAGKINLTDGFAIVRGGSAAVDTSNVLALGAEYPDRNYVSIWLGGHSPIVIYNSLETALAAYSTDDEPAGLFWLDA